MTALETDFTKAIATLVKVEQDLRSADAQSRIEIATAHNEVSIERGITRDLVAEVHTRVDRLEEENERRHREVMAAISKLGGSRGQ